MAFTLEELERRAYIEGRTAEAWALGQAINVTDERIFELEQQVEYLTGRNRELEYAIEELESEF